MTKGTELFEEAQTWLQSSRAHQYAARLLRIKRIGMDPKEVCDDALFGIWHLVQKDPDRDIENVQGYCTRIMDNVIMQVLRGYRDLGFDPLDEGDPGRSGKKKLTLQAGIDVAPLTDPTTETDRSLVGQLRSSVEAVGRSPGPTSAVLTYLTLRAFTEEEIDVTGLPGPKRGARKDDHARWWPSLHLAHQDPGLFPWMGRQYPAQRQRLQRARRAAEQVLDRAKFLIQNGVVS